MAEYTSASITAQLLHWLIRAGFDPDLIDTAHRIVRDELDHAALSHDTLVALGGADTPSELDVDQLAMPTAPEGVLASALDSILRNFCFGETFAVPLFAAMREHTTHPAVLPMLERVLRDEAIHRQFGWDCLDALIARDAAGVQARSASKIRRFRSQFQASYGTLHQSDPLLPIEIAAGMMPPARYVEIHDATLRDVIIPRFALRGIDVTL
jgi:hypothetical protein